MKIRKMPKVCNLNVSLEAELRGTLRFERGKTLSKVTRLLFFPHYALVRP